MVSDFPLARGGDWFRLSANQCSLPLHVRAGPDLWGLAMESWPTTFARATRGSPLDGSISSGWRTRRQHLEWRDKKRRWPFFIDEAGERRSPARSLATIWSGQAGGPPRSSLNSSGEMRRH